MYTKGNKVKTVVHLFTSTKEGSCMDFQEVVKKRSSCRSFLSQSIPQEILQALFEVIKTTPSAGNLRAFKIYFTTDHKKKQALAQAALGQEYVATAPVVFIFCALPQKSSQRYGQRGVVLYALQDATIAATFMHLAATNLGLGSVWIGAFAEEKIQAILHCSSDEKPIALMPIGYSGTKSTSRTHKNFADSISQI